MKKPEPRACLPSGRLRRPPRSPRVPDWQRPFFSPEDPLWRDPEGRN